MARAWRVSAGHPPFATLGWKSRLMGYAALPYMPKAAMVHVKRHFFFRPDDGGLPSRTHRDALDRPLLGEFMPIDVLMPALSPTMEEGKLAKWLVREGDAVRAGDVIAEIETDKATMEVEAADDGRLGKILVPEGTEHVAVNQPIALLLAEDEAPAGASSFEMRPPAAPQAEDQARHEGSAPHPEEGASAPVSTGEARDAFPRIEASTNPPASRWGAGVGRELGESAARYRGGPGGAADRPCGTSARPEVPPGTEMVAMTVREALRDAMAEEMRRDPAVFVMGEEVGQYQGAYKVTQGLLDEFGPLRVVDTPITEYGFAGVGVGAAFAGLKPIVEFMTWNFAMQAIDHIINSAAKTLYMSGGKMHCPIVFRGPNGAAARVAAQHSQNYAAWYAHVPGLKVIAPYTAADAKGLLEGRDPRSEPGDISRARNFYGTSFEVPTLDDSCCRSARRAWHAPGAMSPSSPSRAAWPMRSMLPSISPCRGSRRN